MTNQEILTRAIEQAIAGGYKVTGLPREFKVELPNVVFNGGNLLLKWEAGNSEHTITLNLSAVIFSHDFAKALWGEHDMDNTYQTHQECRKCGDDRIDYEHELDAGSCWEFHLRNMVIADDPIKYLGANI